VKPKPEGFDHRVIELQKEDAKASVVAPVPPIFAPVVGNGSKGIQLLLSLFNAD